MRKITPLYPLVCAITLTGTLHGCATYDKCGAGGCPGDSKITANVQAQFAQHAEIGPLVEVQTLDGVVYLNGQVTQGLQRDIAESVARGTPGVVKVVDNIGLAK
ncbi:MAG TPA: BON domain-containing protein [Steroidobacteraceae bacterium]|nr:BON domain-containing protein [Steroidobacteraceae bacterium]